MSARLPRAHRRFGWRYILGFGAGALWPEVRFLR